MIEPREARQDAVRFLVGAVWLGGAGASLAFCANLWFVEDRAALWTSNALDPVQRRSFVVTVLIAAVLPGLLAAIPIRTRSLAAVAADVERWGDKLAPLALLAPIAPLLDRASFVRQPVTSLSYILVIGLAAAAIGTRCLERGFADRPEPVGSESRGSWLPAALTGGVCLGLFAHFGFYAVLRHHQMRSIDYDLAIFDNLMWQLTHGEGFASTPAFGPEGNHLHRHTTFGAPLLVPFYALWPRAETLLVLQAAFAASTPIPIFALGRRLLGSAWLGCVFAVCYALYAPNHGAVFYDFHFLTMAAPLFAWVFFLLFTEHTRALAAMTIVTLGWREDTGAVLAFAGAVVWLAGVHRRRTLIFMIVSAVYFGLVKFVFMPLGAWHLNFADYYRVLLATPGGGFQAIVETFVTNPYFVFDEVFDKKRLLYILHLFVPLLFFPLRDRRTWIAMIPAAVFTLMASRDPLYQIYFQYTVYWAPAAFLGLFLVLRRRFVATGRRRALVANAGAVLLATVLSSYLFGSVFESPTMRGGFGPVSYEWTERDAIRYDAFQTLADQIPDDASVALTTREAPHMSNRRHAYSLRIGAFDADYLLVRRSAVRKKRSIVSKTYRDAIDSNEYTNIAEEGPFTLWKRVSGKDTGP